MVLVRFYDILLVSFTSKTDMHSRDARDKRYMKYLFPVDTNPVFTGTVTVSYNLFPKCGMKEMTGLLIGMGVSCSGVVIIR